jgi:hypothetical protein
MYTIEKNNDEVIVNGPNGFQKNLPKTAVGVVFRRDPEEVWDDSPRPFVVQVDRMTDLEIIACALDIDAYTHTGIGS